MSIGHIWLAFHITFAIYIFYHKRGLAQWLSSVFEWINFLWNLRNLWKNIGGISSVEIKIFKYLTE